MGFLLDSSELRLFDIVTSDHTAAGGDDVNYYSVNKHESKVDPLYGEYTKRQVDGPWRLPAAITWPDRQPAPGETGFTVEWDGKIEIARVHLDDRTAPYPTEDDVFEFWRSPYHDATSLGQGMFFDVIKVVTDGHLNDAASFTKFIVTLKRRTDYAAERRLP